MKFCQAPEPVSLLALAFLFILIYFLSRRFIKPDIDLAQAMGEVEVEMREKTMPVAGSDGLSRLAQSHPGRSRGRGSKGNRSKTAEILGVNRKTLWEKINAYQLDL